MKVCHITAVVDVVVVSCLAMSASCLASLSIYIHDDKEQTQMEGGGKSRR